MDKLKSIIDVEQNEINKLLDKHTYLERELKEIQIEISRRKQKLKPLQDDLNKQIKEDKDIRSFLEKGKVKYEQPSDGVMTTCGRCGGLGKIGEVSCPYCWDSCLYKGVK